MTVLIMLKQIREARGLSQNKLARAVDLTSQYIQKIEYGKVKSLPLETLDRLCVALQCEPGDLLVRIPNDEGQGGQE